jgi:hypothetical protein
MVAKWQILGVVDDKVVDWWGRVAATAIDPIKMGLRYVRSVDANVKRECVYDLGK